MGLTTEALVIAGHGSHLNPDSSTPVYAHAETIRARGHFFEVREAFWKGEPSFRDVLRTLSSDVVYAVPLFMSNGYFVEEVIPRELRLTDEWELDVEKTVHYTEPVGTHELMADVIVKRAATITGDPNVGDGFGLAVVGHGTERHESSGRSTREHAATVRERERFDEVHALFLDESPSVDDVTEHFECSNVIVVPLFVSNGYHTREDIPENLGLTDDYRTEYDVPADVGEHRIWYTGAVGTEPLLADVVLERARDAGAAMDRPSAPESDSVVDNPTATAFLQWLEQGERQTERDEGFTVTRTWGQLAITISEDDGKRTYEIRHEADRNTPRKTLERYTDPLAVRELSKFDDEGTYRPLSTAPTLPTGWVVTDLDSHDVVQTIGRFYPATIANWYRERNGELDVTHWQSAANRQTGRYDVADERSRTAVDRAVEVCCVDVQCLKRRTWGYNDEHDLDVPPGDGVFPCREPCSFLFDAVVESQLTDETDTVQ